MKKQLLKSLLVLLWFLAFTLTGCKEEQPRSYSRDLFAMDTYITCQVVAEDEEMARAGLDAVDNAFLGIDLLTNRFDEKSELHAVNKNAGIAPVKVSEDLFNIVETALLWSDKTDGDFNILIGSVMDLWGFGSDNPKVPADEDLAAALTTLDYHKIVLDSAKSTLFLPEKGMSIDLGGIAKGYATDKAVAALKELGIKNALINAGGNVYAMGTKIDGTSWRVGVQDPRNPQGVKVVLAASDTALVSSGDYQRYFEVGGIRYHHVMDPATGYPTRASAGATVIMKSATVADILSKVALIRGPVKGIELAESNDQVEAVLVITGDGAIAGTRSLSEYVIE